MQYFFADLEIRMSDERMIGRGFREFHFLYKLRYLTKIFENISLRFEASFKVVILGLH